MYLCFGITQALAIDLHQDVLFRFDLLISIHFIVISDYQIKNALCLYSHYPVFILGTRSRDNKPTSPYFSKQDRKGILCTCFRVLCCLKFFFLSEFESYNYTVTFKKTHICVGAIALKYTLSYIQEQTVNKTNCYHTVLCGKGKTISKTMLLFLQYRKKQRKTVKRCCYMNCIVRRKGKLKPCCSIRLSVKLLHYICCCYMYYIVETGEYNH